MSISFLGRNGRRLLVTYICAGDPDLETTAGILEALAGSGVDVLEVGVPFSDPLADGPVIQSSMRRALDSGTTLQATLDMVGHAVESGRVGNTPVVLMLYYNLIYRRGLAEFASGCRNAGVRGVIVPDLPPEEALLLDAELSRCGIDRIPLVAPTTNSERLSRVLRGAGGFVYCVSITGVTGKRDSIPPELGARVAEIRSFTDLPVCVGFGVSSGEQAARMCLATGCDGVVVGSALIEKMSVAGDRSGAISFSGEFARELRQALDAVSASQTGR